MGNFAFVLQTVVCIPLFFVGLYKLVRGVAAQPDGDFVGGMALIFASYFVFVKLSDVY